MSFVHRYDDLADRELVGLIASSLAFGNVKTILAKVGDALRRLGPSPARAAEDLRAATARMRGWKHRVFVGSDVARLAHGARRVQLAHGSLGARFAVCLRDSGGDLRVAIADFAQAIREAGGLAPVATRRGPSHILPSANGKSAMKRMALFLRWMARPADGVDLGAWRGLVPPSALVVPLDVHVHRLGRNLRLTDRRDATWETAVEITRGLRRADPDDPVRYDFGLCHLGMVQGCPSRRAAVCDGCPLRTACRHWC